MDREQSLVTEIGRRRVENEQLQSNYRALAASDENLLVQAGLMTNPPSLSIGVAGVGTSPTGKYMMVTFDDGVFDHGSHFKLGAKSLLQKVAKALSQFSEPLQIEVGACGR